MKQMQKLKNEEGDSDDYLIELIGLKRDFPAEAMTAYGQVYDRFWDEMLTIAIKATKDEQKAMDLVSDTFNMVYSKAGTFKKEKIRNKENIHIAILYWMTRIMMNVFYDNYLPEEYYHSKSNKAEFKENESPNIIQNNFKPKQFDSYEDDFFDLLEKQENDADNESTLTYEIIEDEEQEIKSENLKKIEEYLLKISERDRDIILMTYNSYTPGKKTPSSILDELEQRWGTSRENIRQILSKFRKSISKDLSNQIFLRK